MAISVLMPVEGALSRTREVLFAPFDLTKWFTLGFCAFLANLGRGGGSSSGGGGSWDGSHGGELEQGKEWLRDHWEIVATVGGLVLLVFLAIWGLILWLQGRGRFMFVDGVARNRGAVVEPWGEYRAEGNSVFKFSLCVSALAFVAMGLTVALGAFLAWNDVHEGNIGSRAWAGLVLAGFFAFVIVVTVMLIDLFLNDFVVPAMYKRRIGVMEGWSVAWNEVITPYAGHVFLYVLMKILITLVTVALVFGLICITFCTAACVLAIPYIGTVLLLPIYVFIRSYSLCFLEQIGGEWELFARDPAAARSA